MLNPDNLMTIGWVSSISNSAGEPVPGTEREHLVLFNKTQITEEQVGKLIDEDRWKRDPRILEVTREQLKFLRDKD